jgi:hypothetical protein
MPQTREPFQALLVKYEISPRCAGSVGPGWVPLVESLIQDLIAMGWDKRLAQVKEKFGLLRFYISAGTEEMRNRIGKAEGDSALICEDCGAAGTLQGENWVRTLCSSCMAKTSR